MLVAGPKGIGLPRFAPCHLAVERLVAPGKVVVPGFHHVRRNCVRANQDDIEANNLRESFKFDPATEPVPPNVRC